jgi:hypothetical protein
MKKLAIVFTLLIVLSPVLVIGCGGGKDRTPGSISKAREAALQTDIRLVQEAVDAYIAFSMMAPTEDGRLPAPGEHAPIDFYASYIDGGNTIILYPDFLLELPRHHDEGIWLIDSGLKVSVDIDTGEY